MVRLKYDWTCVGSPDFLYQSWWTRVVAARGRGVGDEEAWVVATERLQKRVWASQKHFYFQPKQRTSCLTPP